MIECQNVTGETFSTLYNRLKSDELSLPNFVLICISKQDYPDKELVRLNHKQAYIYELEAMKDRLYRYQSIKEGRAMPKRCGLCDYCRATKKLSLIHISFGGDSRTRTCDLLHVSYKTLIFPLHFSCA